MTGGGVAAVARHEVRLRLRAGRWRWLLGVWFVVTGVFTALLRLALGAAVQEEPDVELGAVMYGALLFFVLALALLVVPALSSQSVNGDRDRGTLALLQVTLLTPAEIALGKLAAAWGTALVFLALTAPWVAWCVLEGGVPPGRLVATLLVVVGLLGVFAAVGLGLSALLSRTTTSSVLAYLVVFALTVGTVVTFGLVSAATAADVVRTYTSVQCADEDGYAALRYGPDGEPVGPLPEGCLPRVERYTESVLRTDRTWWLLAPNPFVVLADAAPRPGERDVRTPDGRVLRTEPATFEPLSAIGEAVRNARRGPDLSEGRGLETLRGGVEEDRSPVWPYGLVVDLLLGALAVALTALRLRTPARRLPRGQRVA